MILMSLTVFLACTLTLAQDDAPVVILNASDIQSVWQFPNYPPRPSDDGLDIAAVVLGTATDGRPAIAVFTQRDFGQYGKAGAYAVAHFRGKLPPLKGGGSGTWTIDDSRRMESNLFHTGQAHSEAYVGSGVVRWKVSEDGESLEIADTPGEETSQAPHSSITDHAQHAATEPAPWMKLRRISMDSSTRGPRYVAPFYRP